VRDLICITICISHTTGKTLCEHVVVVLVVVGVVGGGGRRGGRGHGCGSWSPWSWSLSRWHIIVVALLGAFHLNLRLVTHSRFTQAMTKRSGRSGWSASNCQRDVQRAAKRAEVGYTNRWRYPQRWARLPQVCPDLRQANAPNIDPTCISLLARTAWQHGKVASTCPVSVLSFGLVMVRPFSRKTNPHCG
jgi:hypothetical protein